MTHTNKPDIDGATGKTARLKEGYDAALDRTVDVTGKAIDAASGAARRASHSIDANPIALLAGGIAVGAVIGALIPRSEQEKALLAPVGARLSSTAALAIAAARNAGKAELEARGLTRETAQGQARELFQNVLKAAGSAGMAAKDAATTSADRSAE